MAEAYETIDSQMGMIPEFTTHNQEHQINDPNIKKIQTLLENNNTQITNFSQISPTDDQKLEQIEGSEVKNPKRVRVRKKGKGSKKITNLDFERSSVCDCDKRGGRERIVYFREEIEGLRYLGLEEQNKKWIEVYCGLGSDVAKEYDCLVSCKSDCLGNYVHFDPRVQFADKMGLSADVVGNGNESENIGREGKNTNQVDHLSGVIVSDFEEDYHEDEDSDPEYFSIQRPAFYVTGEPDFDSGPPQDGLEYLRRVRWEVEHIPKVKIAKAARNVLHKEQTVYMPNIPDIAPCPEHLLPSKEWENVFLADFSNLRMYHRLPTGLVQVIEKVTPETVNEFYSKWYNFHNIVVGDFPNTLIVVYLIKKYFGSKVSCEVNVEIIWVMFHLLTGLVQVIEKVTPETVNEFYSKWYNFHNIVVGDFPNTLIVVYLIKKYFGSKISCEVNVEIIWVFHLLTCQMGRELLKLYLQCIKPLNQALSQNEGYASTFSGNIDSVPLAQSIIDDVTQENIDFCQTDDDTIVIQENLDFNQTEDNTTICDLPNLQTIMETEPVARVKLLRKRILSMDTKSSLGRPDCAWLFALCAAIDTPLDGDTSASLRCLLRKCANLRAEKSFLDDEVIMLNIMVTVSGKYFGQLETV